jgi:uncharacterized protein (DUF736 family)
MRKSALIIGSFTATETGFKGKLDTVAIKAGITFRRNEDKEKDSHPDYTVTSDSNGYDIGVAWERGDDRGHYISVSFEEPSFAAGYYTLTKSGAEKGYTLTYKRPMPKKDGK